MPWRDERGSSVVEFVLITTLLLLLLFGVLQVGVYLYVRNVVAAAAADGARFAASAGSAPSAGGQRADELLRAALHSGGSSIRCDATLARDTASGLDVVTVRCAGRVRSVFAPIGAWLSIDVTGSSLREQVP